MVLLFARGDLYAERAQRPGLPRIVTSLFQVMLVALVFALVNGEQYSSYYIFYGTLRVRDRDRSASPATSTSASPACCCARPATAAARCWSARASTSRTSRTRSPTRCTRRSRWSASSRSRRARTTGCARSGGSTTCPRCSTRTACRRSSSPTRTSRRSGRSSSSTSATAAACTVRIAPSTMEILVHRAEFVPGASVPLFELRPPVFDGVDYVVKRTFDFCISALLVLLLSPVLLACAAAVRLSSRGPVLYRSIRPGHRRRAVRVLQVPHDALGRRPAAGRPRVRQRGDRARCSRSARTRA